MKRTNEYPLVWEHEINAHLPATLFEQVNNKEKFQVVGFSNIFTIKTLAIKYICFFLFFRQLSGLCSSAVYFKTKSPSFRGKEITSVIQLISKIKLLQIYFNLTLFIYYFIYLCLLAIQQNLKMTLHKLVVSTLTSLEIVL